ncbi:MAG: hypothetical protein GKS07_02865 [Nitrosopumilus sp.]|nr:MAG: hypothetical protein GKS07_02865 [Nitrosopumilus sp.]
MKKNATIGIIGGITIIMTVAVIALTFSEESKTLDSEDMLDGEPIKNGEKISEMQAKWDEIEKIKLENNYLKKERQWITSGPFQIDRDEYDLGQKIFLVIEGLKLEEKGQIAFLRQLNDTHYSVYQTIPFDGERKTEFNYYMQPKLSISKGICSIEDIAGNWAVVFKGTDHKSITFEITDKIISNENENYQQPVC